MHQRCMELLRTVHTVHHFGTGYIKDETELQYLPWLISAIASPVSRTIILYKPMIDDNGIDDSLLIAAASAMKALISE